MLDDLRFGVRMLARSPWFTLAAVVCMGIGIGVATSVFSQMGDMVWRDTPGVSRPETLLRFQIPVSFPEFEEYRDKSGVFQSLAAYAAPVPFVVSVGSRTERVWGHLVTPDYFSVLGVPVQFGPGTTAVISHRLWQSRFGGDPQLFGRTVRINGRPVTIAGAAPQGFLGASPMLSVADVWMPVTVEPAAVPELQGNLLHDRNEPRFQLIGALKPGIGTERAEAALDAMARQFEILRNAPNRNRPERRITLLPGGRLLPIRDQDMALVVGLPALLVGLILLMACTNIATMLLSRAASRRREFAVRLALGAKRGRLVRQLMTESLLIALPGAALGCLLAWWRSTQMDTITAVMPTFIHMEMKFDWKAGLVATILAMGAGMLAGLIPALHATRIDISPGLKPSDPPRRRWLGWLNLRNVLVLQQVTAAMILLLVTGFITMGIQKANTVHLGFEARGLHLAAVDPQRDGYSRAEAETFFAALPERIRRIPGVVAAGLTKTAPDALLSGGDVMTAKIEMLGGPKQVSRFEQRLVGIGFLETFGLPVVRGRIFREGDQNPDVSRIVVNESMARESWPGIDPIGQTLEVEGRKYEVIGVIGNVQPPIMLKPPAPVVYRAAAPADFASPTADGITLLVRTAPGAATMMEVRRTIEATDSRLTVFHVSNMAEIADNMLALMRVGSAIYGGVGLFGLILALVGLAGVTSFAVTRRTHEIGIRVAVGASAGNVLGLVLRESTGIVAVGAALGIAGAFAALQALKAIFVALSDATRTSTTDPLLIFGAPLLLTGLALLSCYLPARRALKIDPITALRSE